MKQINLLVILSMVAGIGYSAESVTIEHYVRPSHNALVSLQETGEHGNNYIYADMKSISDINLLDQNISIKFGSHVVTIDDAIDKLLLNSGYKLAGINNQDQYTQAMLANKFPATQKSITNASLRQSLLALTGNNFDMIVDPIHRIISLKIKPSVKALYFKEQEHTNIVQDVSKTNQIIQNLYSPIETFAKLKDYQTIVSLPLTQDGLASSATHQDVSKYALKHAIYFGFNSATKIVAIASNQKEANALATKERTVFYAVAGENLKQTITRWAQDSGYTLYYQAKDEMTIASSATFFGKFVVKDGSLQQLMNVVTEAHIHIKAQFSSNNVLVIKDNPYSPLLLTGENSHA
jgi:hypothetical protein